TRDKACALGLTDRVLFAGQTANVNQWYQAMDCFVLPSLFEGLPVVGVEAQAAGLPCFFSDCVTDEILLAPDSCRVPLEASDGEWAKRILSVKERAIDRTKGAQLVRSAGFDIHTEAKKLQEIYLKKAQGK
ncbi:MAG: glycosyltransferase, partial [Clostridia bacterium]|nr:glycosyltransferase [Clostridia bacterium]